METKFFNLTIVHPHSGKVSRSIVSRLIKHEVNGYLNTDKENAEYLESYTGNVIHLKDTNGKIIIDKIYRK